jgi:putative ABC transport system permease protein
VLAAGECAVLNIVVLDAHQRAHDLGVFKAPGMTARQPIAVITAPDAGIARLARAIAARTGVRCTAFLPTRPDFRRW